MTDFSSFCRMPIEFHCFFLFRFSSDVKELYITFKTCYLLFSGLFLSSFRCLSPKVASSLSFLSDDYEEASSPLLQPVFTTLLTPRNIIWIITIEDQTKILNIVDFQITPRNSKIDSKAKLVFYFMQSWIFLIYSEARNCCSWMNSKIKTWFSQPTITIFLHLPHHHF